jgi:hypothetical protein
MAIELRLNDTFKFADLQPLHGSDQKPPVNPDDDMAYIFHVTSWTDGGGEAEGGVPVMRKSVWYAYRCKKGVCKVQYAPNNAPLLYNSKHAALISIEAFPFVKKDKDKELKPPTQATVSLSYSFVVTQQTAANVASVKSALGAILGVAAPKLPGALPLVLPNSRAICVAQFPIDPASSDLPYDIKVTVTNKAATDKAAADKAAADQAAADKAIRAAMDARKPDDDVKAAAVKEAAVKEAVDQAIKTAATDKVVPTKAAVDKSAADQAAADKAITAAIATGNFDAVKAAKDRAIETAAAKAAPDPAAGNTPAPLTQTFHALDREWWDLGIGMSTIPLRETVVTTVNGNSKLSTVNRINPYGFFDVYPFFAKFPKNTPWVPHFQVGVPLSGQPLHRPYAGIGVPLPWIERYMGFTVGVFGGIAFMRSQYSSAQNPHWVKKRMIGVELPVGQLLSKISGIKSK